MKRPMFVRCLLLLLTVSQPVPAHKPSDSYLSLAVSGTVIDGQWDIALRDLDYAIGLDGNDDGNDDGAITWGELRRRHAAITAYALARLQVASAGAQCRTRATGHLVDRHSDGAYAVFRFVADCPRAGTTVEIDYRLFFDIDSQHKGLLRLQHRDTVQTAIFTAEHNSRRFRLTEIDHWRTIVDYTREGIWHIWIGFDHILFLMALLLPAALVRIDRHWAPRDTLSLTFRQVLKIVTAFTIAHSMTLALAVFDLVRLPSALVESVIALSVLFAAANNIRPFVRDRVWLMAFGFGLIHGLGFAAVLGELGLPTETKGIALLAFNLGVEAGQLAVVALVLPIIFLLRNQPIYRRVLLQVGSAAIICVSLVWLIERTTDIRLQFLI
jgi:HupE / UreJ protein